jgi:predicted nuclease of predicted toxin-antitoxin system
VRFLIDANLPRPVIAALERAELQVEFARDVGLEAAPDEQIAARARENDAAPIKQDMDFADAAISTHR